MPCHVEQARAQYYREQQYPQLGSSSSSETFAIQRKQASKPSTTCIPSASPHRPDRADRFPIRVIRPPFPSSPPTNQRAQLRSRKPCSNIVVTTTLSSWRWRSKPTNYLSAIRVSHHASSSPSRNSREPGCNLQVPKARTDQLSPSFFLYSPSQPALGSQKRENGALSFVSLLGDFCKVVCRFLSDFVVLEKVGAIYRIC